MRKTFWRNILLIRPFFVGSSVALMRGSLLRAAVPRIKRQAGVAGVRKRPVFSKNMTSVRTRPNILVNEVARVQDMTRGVMPSVPYARILRHGSEVLAPLQVSFPEKAQKFTGKTCRPSVKWQMDSVTNKVVGRNRKDFSAFNLRKRTVLSVTAAASAVRHPTSPKVVGAGRQYRFDHENGQVLHKATISQEGALHVPRVRQSVSVESAVHRDGQEKRSLSGMDREIARHDAQFHELYSGSDVKDTNFSLGDRRVRMAARRSGSGVDEIMQPQYPGRSIGFL